MAGENHFIIIDAYGYEPTNFKVDLSNLGDEIPSQTLAKFDPSELHGLHREFRLMAKLLPTLVPARIEFANLGRIEITFETGEQVAFVGATYISFKDEYTNPPAVFGPLPNSVKVKPKRRK